jgi:hypothetical protein
MQLFSVPNYKIFAERGAFLVIGGGAAMYIACAKRHTRRCLLEMLTDVAEKNSFVYSCQK